MAKDNKFILNIVVLLIAIIFSFILAEFIIRIFYPQSLNFIALGGELRYQLRPNAHTKLIRTEFKNEIIVNSKGLRDIEFSYEKPEGTMRIAAIGDSFPFGYGVEADQSYPKVIEKILSNRTSSSIEVLNFGVPGASTDYALLQLSNEVVKYGPDVILLGFNGQTDLFNNLDSDFFMLEEKKLVKKKVSKIPLSIKLRSFLSSKLHLYNLANFIWVNYRTRGNYYNTLDRAGYLIDFNGLIYTKRSSPELEEAFTKTEFLIKTMKNLSNKIGAEFVLLIIPSKEQVDERKLKERLGLASISMEELDIKKIQRRLITFSEENNIKYIDLLPEFKKRNTDNTFYFEIDGHFNKDGCKLVGQLIVDWLIKEKLID